MNLAIRLFGIAREITGQTVLHWEVEEPFRVANLVGKLEQEYPEFARLHSIMVAVNEDYTEDDTLLKASDEIAVIPPVSGG